MINIDKKPLIISGPCSAETREQTLATCKAIKDTNMVDVIRAGAWKPRTKPGNFEGVGVIALEWLNEAKQITGLPISIEVATAKHVEEALKHNIDMLWIGARTTVNPFSVQEIAESLRGVDIPIMVKNPVNPDLGLWIGAIERLQNIGIKHIGAIHRGFSVYGKNEYRNSPLWNIALELKRLMPELPMLCDPSHISGNANLIQEIAQKGADLDYNGLIIESHICPQEAWSDAKQQVTPQRLKEILQNIKWREKTSSKDDFRRQIDQLRLQIDTIDDELFALLARRMSISDKIGEIKLENNVSILQTQRWDNMVVKRLQLAKELGLSQQVVKDIMEQIHIESINRQNTIMNK